MFQADLVQAVATLGLLALLLAGRLEEWMIYGLLSVASAAANFTNMATVVLLTPAILSHTNDAVGLGAVCSVFGLGSIVGGGLMATWGGPCWRVHGVFGVIMLNGLLSQVLFGLGATLPVWLAASFANGVLAPIYTGSSRAIWQTKVAPALQGRVFALRLLVSRAAVPLGSLCAGALADGVFAPAMQGALGRTLAPVLGEAPGRHFNAMFIVFGALSILVGGAGYLLPRTRRVERELPDAADAECLERDPGVGGEGAQQPGEEGAPRAPDVLLLSGQPQGPLPDIHVLRMQLLQGLEVEPPAVGVLQQGLRLLDVMGELRIPLPHVHFWSGAGRRRAQRRR